MHFIVAQAQRVAHYVKQVLLPSPPLRKIKKKEMLSTDTSLMSEEGWEKRRGSMWTVLIEQPGQGLLSLL